ncbi:MAG: noncanonical pyrimidine nucleotidase, YjjG family [Balneolaceae bacterium]|nr:MAG: noncanonical pyrimidine nucleotidase, YjjG family [Balneolaceae bacterium]
MKHDFVFFDLDNTLLDHSAAEKSAHGAIHSLFEELRQVDTDQWLATYKAINTRLWLEYQKGETDRHTLQKTRFRESMEKLGIDTRRSEQIGKRYMEVYRDYWGWIEGAEEALMRVAEQYPVGFITNGFLETQQRKIDFLNLKRFSSIFIISEEVGVMKPHPKVFDLATEKADTSRKRIVYVGDSYSSDIVGGRNAGWSTAWYTAYTSVVSSGQTADFSFDQFPDLVGYLIPESTK